MPKVEIVLPTLNATKTVTSNFHVDDAQRIHNNVNTRDDIYLKIIFMKKIQWKGIAYHEYNIYFPNFTIIGNVDTHK